MVIHKHFRDRLVKLLWFGYEISELIRFLSAIIDYAQVTPDNPCYMKRKGLREPVNDPVRGTQTNLGTHPVRQNPCCRCTNLNSFCHPSITGVDRMSNGVIPEKAALKYVRTSQTRFVVPLVMTQLATQEWLCAIERVVIRLSLNDPIAVAGFSSCVSGLRSEKSQPPNKISRAITALFL